MIIPRILYDYLGRVCPIQVILRDDRAVFDQRHCERENQTSKDNPPIGVRVRERVETEQGEIRRTKGGKEAHTYEIS